MDANENNITNAIRASTSLADSVEHIFFEVPSGNYKIRVLHSGGIGDFQEYGLAWWAGEAPMPPSGDFDGDGDVDGDDLSQWEGDYGQNGDSDADGDGDSDGADFLAWQRNFVGTAAAQGSQGGSTISTLPTIEHEVIIDDSNPLSPNPNTVEISFDVTSRPVTQDEIDDGGSGNGPEASAEVHDFFVTTDADILTIGGASIETTADSLLYNHPYGSNSEAPDPAFVELFQALGADSFITTPGDTATVGGDLGDDDVWWFDTTNDGSQQEILFARLTTTGGIFEGVITLAGADGPVTIPFSFVFGDAATSLAAVPEPASLLMFAFAGVGFWSSRSYCHGSRDVH